MTLRLMSLISSKGLWLGWYTYQWKSMEWSIELSPSPLALPAATGDKDAEPLQMTSPLTDVSSVSPLTIIGLRPNPLVALSALVLGTTPGCGERFPLMARKELMDEVGDTWTAMVTERRSSAWQSVK